MAFCIVDEEDIGSYISERISNRKTTFHRTSEYLDGCVGAISIVAAVLLSKRDAIKVSGDYDVRETEIMKFEEEFVEIPTCTPSCDHYNVLQKANYPVHVATLKAGPSRFTEIALIVLHTPSYAGCDFVPRWFEPFPVSHSIF
jgi:hypothetical protein